MYTKLKLKSWLAKTALALALALPVLPAGVPAAYAEGPTDPAPVIAAKVVNGNAGKKVLFDNTHGQTAGAADWVIDGAFSDFAHALANDGYEVKELRKTTPITYNDLASYDVFVIPEPNIPYKQSEQAAMLQYVQSGGSIFFIGDHYNADRNKNRWDSNEIFNGYRRGAYTNPTQGMSEEERSSEAMQGIASSDWLATHFGVRFRYNALGDIITNRVVSSSQTFGITSGVNTVAMHAGATLAIMDPTKAKGIVFLPETNDAWPNAVDQGVYNGGGVAEGPYVAIAKTGAGKAAFIGDSSPVEDVTPKYLREDNGRTKTTYDGFKEQDDGKLLVNLINWLSKDESYTSFSEVPGLQLDAPTALHAFEVPAQSTEPKPEPWAAPDAGYKWWDRSTFKPGSYGGSGISYQPVYSFVKQAQLPNAESFQLRVVVENMQPNSTISGYTLGIYLNGGAQVAQVQNADGSWPTTYGYSSVFSLTANDKGRATKDLTVRIKPGTNGTANLRIRLNGSNLKTETVTLANVPAEQLPPDENEKPETITIAEARQKSDDTTVSIEGVVTTRPGSFGTQSFYVQDATGGMYIYQHAAGYQPGDVLSITGTKTVYNTEVEIIDPTIEKKGTASLPAAAAATEVNEANQGQLIELSDVTIGAIRTASPSGSFEFNAVSGSASTLIRVDGRTGLTLSSFPYAEGDTVSIKGVSAIFRGTYQLKPRGLDDFTAVDRTVPVTTATTNGVTGNNGWFTSDATVELEATDAGGGTPVTYVQLGDGAWSTYAGPIVITEEGQTALRYYSKDAAGNQEQTNSLELKLDKSAPTAKLLMNGGSVRDVTYSDRISFTLTADDAVSGIALKQLYVDGSPVAEGAVLEAAALGLGSHTIRYEVMDAAGHTVSESFSFNVGTTVAELMAVVNKLGQEGQFHNHGTQRSLEAKLSQVESKLAKGQADQARKHLENALATMNREHMTAHAAAAIEQLIQYLLTNELK
ncbi:OmpL47-type beta-barrel domain-containing protein [Paenibacillus sp. YYML68]|uniref:OmpL47-type beta-barrel domain-containing protein n=1 Tax=Paenibacillus sp. YYML68 TaxID=2909250 RepID=UPI0024920E72|nr:endonuclease [Paenibacillus sp. YYML68]